MCGLKMFQIDLKTLGADGYRLTQRLDDTFFALVKGEEVQHGDLSVEVAIQPVEQAFDVDMKVEGEVQLTCDRCLESYMQPISATQHLVVTLGDTFEEDENTMTLPVEQSEMDLSWLIYELIVLALPFRHVHAPGNCNPAMMSVLEAHSTNRSGEERATVDPRWSELEKIKNNI